MRAFRFDAPELPADTTALRQRLRAFLAEQRDAGLYKPNRNSWISFNAEFSRRAGKAGFIGITWPKEFGGHALSNLHRYVVTEEMLAHGAPCGAHWIADRQSGPQILRHGSDRMKRLLLPGIAAGECYFGIGMSEPDTGSDLASVRSRAAKTEGGWLINGAKIWTSNAHHAHYLIVLVRTAQAGENRHIGLTQFIVDMQSPGITVRPIRNLAGVHEFNEVVFRDCFVPDDAMLGAEGMGWSMVTAELAFERSGPDRFLSDYRLLAELINKVGARPDARQSVEVGRLIAHAAALRRMSVSIAGLLEKGHNPATEAALVKEVGTSFEREIPEVARKLVPVEPSFDEPGDDFSEALAYVLLNAPSFTLRGGTREILRGMIARGLGLR
ncbi:acyl-CoA dehydrogenase family protein [Ferrovibrio sp. MS7]|uniref:acyl-CoA dehydrogenase family protein n=1 Tax=Ferrovibrio plantarum TaxID=3119164 RepID=UPI003134C0D0